MVIDAVKEVGGPSFFALLVIAVSFLPVLTLEAQEGRLFKPLAYTKNLLHDHRGGAGHHARPGHAAAVHPHAAISTSGRAGWRGRSNAVLVGKIHPRRTHPISRILIRLYEPVCAWCSALEMAGDRRRRWRWSR